MLIDSREHTPKDHVEEIRPHHISILFQAILQHVQLICSHVHCRITCHTNSNIVTQDSRCVGWLLRSWCRRTRCLPCKSYHSVVCLHPSVLRLLHRFFSFSVFIDCMSWWFNASTSRCLDICEQLPSFLLILQLKTEQYDSNFDAIWHLHPGIIDGIIFCKLDIHFSS
jgi:hypothetical protein